MPSRGSCCVSTWMRRIVWHCNLEMLTSKMLRLSSLVKIVMLMKISQLFGLNLRWRLVEKMRVSQC